MPEGFPIVVVPSGGIPVTFVESGAPAATISDNGYGLAVTEVASGGLALTPSTGGASFPSWMYNLKASNTTRLRADLTNADDGLWMFAGDSTTQGQGTTDRATKAFPVQVGQYLRAQGIAANWQGKLGRSAVVSNGASPNDTRISYGADWTGDDGLASFGGGILKASSNATSVHLAPAEDVDRIRVYHIRLGATRQMSLAIDGGAAESFNTNGTTGFGSFVKSAGSLGAHYGDILSLPNGTQNYFIGFLADNSAVKKINILNAGWGGSRTSNWASTAAAYSPGSAAAAASLGASVFWPQLGINDWTNGVSVATSKANLQSIITAYKATGDVVLVTSLPTQASVTPLATQEPYIIAQRELAIENDIPLVDIWAQAGSWEAMNALGLMDDFAHGNDDGYAWEADLIGQFIMAAMSLH